MEIKRTYKLIKSAYELECILSEFFANGFCKNGAITNIEVYSRNEFIVTFSKVQS